MHHIELILLHCGIVMVIADKMHGCKKNINTIYTHKKETHAMSFVKTDVQMGPLPGKFLLLRVFRTWTLRNGRLVVQETHQCDCHR